MKMTDGGTEMDDLVERARVFATAAHAAVGQVRKYTFEPYIIHPAQVADIVATTQYWNVNMISAAWLHDVVEDTKVTEDVLREEFGDGVTDLVMWLTNVSKPSDGNRKTRKRKDRDHLAQAPAEAQTIKLADLISNTSTIVKYDPKFAKTYIPEKQELLEVLTKGDKQLWTRAYEMITDAKISMK